nr:class I SAM-dependent methyltransferase [Silvanigrella aquatica]
MQKDGVLHTFELEEKHAAQAAESFQKADVSHLIKQYVGPALENLKTIEKEGPFDAVFIDADKVSYPDYLTWAEKNLKIGGLIIGDNTFAWGNIHNTNIQDKELAQKVNALRDFNARIMRNPKFRATILPTGEGLTVGIKIA